MAENQVADPLIGLAFDGTGFGMDGCIWGGEILRAGLDGFERSGHLGKPRAAEFAQRQAFWAHIGGFLGGIGLVMVFCSGDRLSECRRRRGITQRVFQRYES